VSLAEDSNHYYGYRSGRQAVFEFLKENPELSPKQLMVKLHKETRFGGLKSQVIKNYMTEWRREYSQNGRVPMHHAGRGFVDSGFDVKLWDEAPCFGWKVSRNKNRQRWRYVNGVSFGWSRNGTVDVRFKESLHRGYLLAAFSRAFWEVFLSRGNSERETADFLKEVFEGKFRYVERHSTYDTGQPLPRTVIRDRELSHGETICVGDGSHPTCIEIKEKMPFWASDLAKSLGEFQTSFCKVAADFKETGLLFADNMQKHLSLLDAWQKESVLRQEYFIQMTELNRKLLQQLEIQNKLTV
jgi:hypothetical protein